jgi:hypothetical protein
VSIALNVYLARAAMPAPEGCAEAIRDAGFPVDLDTDFDPDTATGFRPCLFRGVPSGFEDFSSRVNDHERKEIGAPANCDFSVTLVTFSDLREFATALIAASVLCRLSGGLLVDPQAGERYPSSDVLAWAREQLASFEDELR